MFVNIVLEEDCAYNGGINRSPDGDVFFCYVDSKGISGFL